MTPHAPGNAPLARRQARLPFLLVALALAVNLYGLASDSFWGDEILTAIFAGQTPAEVIRWTAGDIHPPLYYLVAGAFARLVISPGQPPGVATDWLWRFPSALAAVLAVAVTYRLARRFAYLGRWPFQPSFAAPAAALLLGLAPVAVRYGQEARMHALFMFLASLSTWLLFRAMARPRVWSRWLVFGLATAAQIYTMYFGFLVLAAQGGYVLFSLARNRSAATSHLRPASGFPFHALRFAAQPPWALHPSRAALHPLSGFSVAVALAFLLYLPWWPVLLALLRHRAAVGAIEGGVGSPLTFVAGVIRALGPAPALAAWAFLLLFGLGVVLLARRHRPLAAFAGLWLALPTLLPLFLGDPRALQFRYAFVLPVYLSVVASAITGASRLDNWSAKTIGSALPRSRPPVRRPASLTVYLLWLLATVSFVATLDIYNLTKPDWRGAAAYLDEHAGPADIILTGPLWDEGRFLGYYYRGQARLLTPAEFVANIERYTAEMRAGGGRLWAVNRFAPAGSPALKNLSFSGVYLSEPRLVVYEPDLLAGAALELAYQAVDAAYPWASAAEAQGILNPDPRTARAAALAAWGDTLVADGRPYDALVPYQTAVEIFPGWANGFIALAETQEKVGNWPAAAQAYRQAVEFNQKWQGPEADAAAALTEAGQWLAALEKYHQLIGEK